MASEPDRINMSVFERPIKSIASVGDAFRDLRGVYLANGVVAFLFSCTGPVAIIVSVGIGGGLSKTEIASWLFGCFLFPGLITIWFSAAYRQPISFAWTIPGTVLLLSAFDHLSFPEMIGAFWVTGILMTIIGFSGGVRKVLDATPMPIVMGMVAGVFLQFGLDLVLAFKDQLWIAAGMVLCFVIVSAIAPLKRVIPPVVAALVVGIITVWITGTVESMAEDVVWLALPNVYWPEFSRQALIELVVPIAITVLLVQNGQGFAVLRAAGHKPPVNTMTFACGVTSLVNAVFGAVCCCVTGPSNAILSSSGAKEKQYSSGILYGVLSVLFGIFAFGFTWLMLILPGAFIAVLAGLAMIPVLERAFVAAFSAKFTLGAFVTFLVTVSGIQIFNIGAPFWGLVFGFTISFILERDDFRKLKGSSSW